MRILNRYRKYNPDVLLENVGDRAQNGRGHYQRQSLRAMPECMHPATCVRSKRQSGAYFSPPVLERLLPLPYERIQSNLAPVPSAFLVWNRKHRSHLFQQRNIGGLYLRGFGNLLSLCGLSLLYPFRALTIVGGNLEALKTDVSISFGVEKNISNT